MTKRSERLPPMGGSILLTVVAVLCLVTFSLLALSAVQADIRLARRSHDAVAAYYEADCRAEEILARLRAGETPNGVTGEDGVFSYACAIDDGRALQVRVRLDGTDYAVLQWQAVSTDLWQADDDLPVWQGGIQ